jgi:hypothetical protein
VGGKRGSGPSTTLPSTSSPRQAPLDKLPSTSSPRQARDGRDGRDGRDRPLDCARDRQVKSGVRMTPDLNIRLGVK